MKTSIKWIIGIVALLAFLCILAALQRVFMFVVGIAVIVAIVAMIRYAIGGQQKSETPEAVLERQAHKIAEKALKNLERRVQTELKSGRGVSTKEPEPQRIGVGLFRK